MWSLIFIILGVIGVCTVIGFLLYLFTAVGKNVTNLQIKQSPKSVHDPNFVYNAASICAGDVLSCDPDAIKIFSDNERWFATLLMRIAQAQRSISCMTYIWEDDETSQQFFSALTAAAARGVTVRLLVDSYGSSVPSARYQAMRTEHFKIGFFRPLRIGKMSVYVSRNHRRAFIFDSQVAYIGGAGISGRWFVNHSRGAKKRFYDTMYEFTDRSGVFSITKFFSELWSSVSGEIVHDLDVKQLTPATTRPNAVFLSHAPRIDVHPLTYFQWYSIMAAKRSVVICSPYFVPGHALAELLMQKARAGVSIVVVTQGTNQKWFVQAAARSYYTDLLEAGVEIFEHQKPHLHSKIMVVDEAWSIIGSANFDIRSQRINHEAVIGVLSESFARKNQQIITRYQEDSRHLTPAAWEKESLHKTALYRFVRNFSEQF